MPKRKDYAVYKGDEFVCLGTVHECASFMGYSLETFKFYTYPTYQRRLKKRKSLDNSLIVIKIEDDEEE